MVCEELDKNRASRPVEEGCCAYRRRPQRDVPRQTPPVNQGVSTVQTAPYRSGGLSVLAGPLAVSRHNATDAPGARRAGPRIAALAVSDSDAVLSQEQVLERLGLSGNEFAEGIFERCGVKQRPLELSDEFLDRTLQGRTAQIEDQLLRHSIGAVDALALDPRQIGTVVSASLYSLGCPTLAHRLVEHYESDPTTDKYQVTGVGCASGVPLMKLAAQSLREHPHKQTLVVAAESMSGTFKRATPQDPRAKTVGSAIFGDGCAALLLSGDRRAEGPVILASRMHQIAGTLGAVSLRFGDEDSYLHLARDLPDLARAGLPGVVERFLRRNRLDRSQIDHWIVHPGGRRIIENVQSALQLSRE